jgi:hypothetical protein
MHLKELNYKNEVPIGEFWCYRFFQKLQQWSKWSASTYSAGQYKCWYSIYKCVHGTAVGVTDDVWAGYGGLAMDYRTQIMAYRNRSNKQTKKRVVIFDSLWTIFLCHYSRVECQTQVFLCIGGWHTQQGISRVDQWTPIHSLLVHWTRCGSATHTSSKQCLQHVSDTNADRYIIRKVRTYQPHYTALYPRKH